MESRGDAFQTGERANLVPAFEKRGNYRPASLTPVSKKILEPTTECVSI